MSPDDGNITSRDFLLIDLQLVLFFPVDIQAPKEEPSLCNGSTADMLYSAMGFVCAL